jgi:hypothetical protein
LPCFVHGRGASLQVLLDAHLDLVLGFVAAVVAALDLLDNGLHLLDLALPLLLAHLALTAEKLLVWLAVTAAEAIPEGGVLAVVVVEVEVVHGVAGGTIDDGRVGYVFAIVNEDGPDVDKGEEENIRKLLEREDEGEDVVRHTLEVAVERVEGVRGVRGRHDPLVVWLVQRLVYEGVVQTAVDEVNPKVGKDEEDRELKPIVPRTGTVGAVVVELRVAANLSEEEGNGEDGHDGKSGGGLSNLHADLVLEELGVLEGVLVEDEDVRQGGEDKVDDETKDPAKN